jgi:hypothetical protein
LAGNADSTTNQSFHHLEPAEAGAILQALMEVGGGFTPPVVRHSVLAYTGARPEEGSALRCQDVLKQSG